MTGHIHITPLGGMAGDMFVAGLLDAFPDFVDAVLTATAAVLPKHNATLKPGVKAGLAARFFDVPAQQTDAPVQYPAMDRILAQADLPDGARRNARAILRLLAEAEAAVHAVPLDQVHFHEIADWDTLADVTAAGVLLAFLDGWSWSLDPLPLGQGTIKTAHGLLPVPAPATARLIQGLTVQDDGIAGERVTPTGAAIVRHIVETQTLTPRPMGRLGATGYGGGTRDLPGMANVVAVQVIVGPIQTGDTITILECDVDDMTGEEIAVACDHLRSCDGVLDVVTTLLLGKKGRLVTGFRVMAAAAQCDAVATEMFAQTSTLGLRSRSEQRLCVPRHGEGQVKVARRPMAETAKIESDAICDRPTLAARRAMARAVER